MATLADYPDNWEEIFLSNPNFSMVEYSRKVDEYQRLLKEKQDSDDASGMSGGAEGAGIRSDQIYDSSGNPVGWGGGAFSPTEMSTGEPEEVEKRYDQWGNEVDMGNRKWGIAFNKALPNVVKVIPGYNVVQAINDAINKNKQQTTASTSTDTTDTTTSNVIPQFLSTVSKHFSPAADWNTGATSGYNWDTPVATNILDVVANTEGNGGGLLDAITAIDMNAPVVDNKPF
jgi:hypothetical protein